MKRIMLLALCTSIGLGAATLTGCGMERDDSSESQPAQANPQEESVAPSEDDEGVDGLVTKEAFYGRVFDEEVRQELQGAVEPAEFRVYTDGDPLTEDLRYGRLNVGLDEAGKIVSLWFDCASWPSEEEGDDDDAASAADSDSGAPTKESFYGRVFDEEVREELQEAVEPAEFRVYTKGSPLTDDFRSGRLNVGLDEAGKIFRLWFDCGSWPTEEAGDEDDAASDVD